MHLIMVSHGSRSLGLVESMATHRQLGTLKWGEEEGRLLNLSLVFFSKYTYLFSALARG